MIDLEKLTSQEEAAMLTLWRLERGTLGVLLDAMPEPKPHYNTFASVFKNLERKGYVAFNRYGNVYEYYPKVAKEAVIGKVMEDYFAHSYKDLVTFFARSEKLSAADLREILALIESNPNR
jgi:predicted transcriptional regulator